MKIIIGLEIHCPLNTKFKLFCNCLRNIETCAICKGEPGSYPLPPKEEVLDKCKKIITLSGLESIGDLIFERKHYHYPDLPKGFQITTRRKDFFKEPAGSPIYFAALEEDPASLKGDLLRKISYSRCGNPLVEIITMPVFNNAEEVSLFYQNLEKDLELNNLKSKKEPLRVDVNISLAPAGLDKEVPNPQIQVKNVHSLTNIMECINTEQKRLSERYIYLAGRKESLTENLLRTDINHTRGYDETSGGTRYSREKESYIFLREINIPPITLSKKGGEKEAVLMNYATLYSKLVLLLPAASAEEVEEVLSEGWASLIIIKLEDKEEKIFLFRYFLIILKYCRLNDYTKQEITSLSNHALENPITKETLKKIIISRTYDEFYARKRINITFQELVPQLRCLVTRSDKIQKIISIEERRILPSINIRELLEF